MMEKIRKIRRRT